MKQCPPTGVLIATVGLFVTVSLVLYTFSDADKTANSAVTFLPAAAIEGAGAGILIPDDRSHARRSIAAFKNGAFIWSIHDWI